MGEEYVVAKYDYQAKDDQELSLKKGERLVLIDDTRNWWKVRNSKEYEGFVPSNFVRKENWKDTVKGTLRKFPELPRKTSQPNVNKQRAALPAFMRSVIHFLSRKVANNAALRLSSRTKQICCFWFLHVFKTKSFQKLNHRFSL